MWHHRSDILEPLARISGSKADFKWTDEQQRAFVAIKNIMARQVLLSYPDFTLPFDIYTDASKHQSGGVITQEGRPIAFYSRKLNSAQRNYTTMERELLSISETATIHKNILLGFKCRFHSDHRNLQFDRFTSDRVHRWRLMLEEYDYDFIYTSGKDNIVADMLSRYPMLDNIPSIEDTVMSIQHDIVFPIDYKLIAKAQREDKSIDYSRFKQKELAKNTPINMATPTIIKTETLIGTTEDTIIIMVDTTNIITTIVQRIQIIKIIIKTMPTTTMFVIIMDPIREVTTIVIIDITTVIIATITTILNPVTSITWMVLMISIRSTPSLMHTLVTLTTWSLKMMTYILNTQTGNVSPQHRNSIVYTTTTSQPASVMPNSNQLGNPRHVYMEKKRKL